MTRRLRSNKEGEDGAPDSSQEESAVPDSSQEESAVPDSSQEESAGIVPAEPKGHYPKSIAHLENDPDFTGVEKDFRGTVKEYEEGREEDDGELIAGFDLANFNSAFFATVFKEVSEPYHTRTLMAQPKGNLQADKLREKGVRIENGYVFGPDVLKYAYLLQEQLGLLKNPDALNDPKLLNLVFRHVDHVVDQGLQKAVEDSGKELEELLGPGMNLVIGVPEGFTKKWVHVIGNHIRDNYEKYGIIGVTGIGESSAVAAGYLRINDLALSIDFGHGTTDLAVITSEGFDPEHCHPINVASRDLQRRLKEFAVEALGRHFPIDSLYGVGSSADVNVEDELTRMLKEGYQAVMKGGKVEYVKKQFIEFADPDKLKDIEGAYDSRGHPDWTNPKAFPPRRFTVPFNTRTARAVSQEGEYARIPEQWYVEDIEPALIEGLEKFPVDLLMEAAQSIVISGGGGQVPGLGKRIARTIKERFGQHDEDFNPVAVTVPDGLYGNVKGLVRAGIHLTKTDFNAFRYNNINVKP